MLLARAQDSAAVFRSGADRMARFEREAKVLAAPTASNTSLVMELLEGRNPEPPGWPRCV